MACKLCSARSLPELIIIDYLHKCKTITFRSVKYKYHTQLKVGEGLVMKENVLN